MGLTGNLAPWAALAVPDAELLANSQTHTRSHVISSFTPTLAATDIYPCWSGAERLPAYLGEDRPCTLLHHKVEQAN
jgi:hypothetical protein